LIIGDYQPLHNPIAIHILVAFLPNIFLDYDKTTLSHRYINYIP